MLISNLYSRAMIGCGGSSNQSECLHSCTEGCRGHGGHKEGQQKKEYVI